MIYFTICPFCGYKLFKAGDGSGQDDKLDNSQANRHEKTVCGAMQSIFCII